MRFRLLFVMFLFLGIAVYGQVDCNAIQCDCENVPDSEKDPGLIALCKYYEKDLKKRCEKGEKNLKCKENAKGPNAWIENEVTENNKDTEKPFDKVNISNIKNIESVKYCKQLIAYVKQKGYSFGNVRVPENLYNEGYFKEAWAYDIDNSIYVIVVLSKEKKDGFSYKLSVEYNNYSEYQFYIYCNVKATSWKKFAEPCNSCDYDKRYVDLLKKFECDCL